MGLYEEDGLCHNAESGTYGHECGKPATWVGQYREAIDAVERDCEYVTTIRVRRAQD